MSRLIGKLLGLTILIVSLGLGWWWQSVNYFTDAPVNFANETVDFNIKPGSSLTTVSRQLAETGLIDSASHFVWMIRLNDLPSSIQAGEYVIRSGMTPKDILLMFANGKVKQHAFTIVEGWNLNQLLTALKNNPHLKHNLKDRTSSEIPTLLGIEEKHAEGFFLPDTYYFSSGFSDIEFLKRAYTAMKNLLESEWQTRDTGLPLNSAYEALILASIVEKETAVASERSKIAGVFTRRIQKNMRLQTDPTVIYGLGESFDGNLKKDHLKDESNPYNTYRIKGLPPTPIALPGADAVRAALHPEQGDELYFVAKGDGSHFFSSNVEEHNKAVRKYQIKQRSTNYRSTPENEDQGT